MKATFLACALALPAMTQDKRYHMLKEFLDEVYRDHDVILVNDQETMIGKQYIKSPLIYRGLRVWLTKAA